MCLVARQTCALLRAETCALLGTKTCALSGAKTCALLRSNYLPCREPGHVHVESQDMCHLGQCLRSRRGVLLCVFEGDPHCLLHLSAKIGGRPAAWWPASSQQARTARNPTAESCLGNECQQQTVPVFACFVGGARSRCRIAEISWKRSGSSKEETITHPEFLQSGDVAEVVLQLERPVPCASFDTCAALARIQHCSLTSAPPCL